MPVHKIGLLLRLAPKYTMSGLRIPIIVVLNRTEPGSTSQSNVKPAGILVLSITLMLLVMKPHWSVLKIKSVRITSVLENANLTTNAPTLGKFAAMVNAGTDAR